jgi:RNA polymerase sigma-70 factor (ECF subfamily)
MKPAAASVVPDSKTADAQTEVLRMFAEQGAPLYRFCRSMLGSGAEAEDVVQDTFLKLLQHLQAAGDRTNLRSWLFTVAANGCRDRTRRRMRWLPWTPALDRRTVEPIAEQPDRAAARRAMQALAARDRLLLSLRAQGLPYADIARATGIQPGSVGRLLARAVDRWKRRLEEELRKKWRSGGSGGSGESGESG